MHRNGIINSAAANYPQGWDRMLYITYDTSAFFFVNERVTGASVYVYIVILLKYKLMGYICICALSLWASRIKINTFSGQDIDYDYSKTTYIIITMIMPMKMIVKHQLFDSHLWEQYHMKKKTIKTFRIFFTTVAWPHLHMVNYLWSPHTLHNLLRCCDC